MLEYYEIQDYVTEVAAGNYPFRVIDAVTADIYERGIASRWKTSRHTREPVNFSRFTTRPNNQPTKPRPSPAGHPLTNHGKSVL